MTTRKTTEQRIAPHPNADLPYDHFGAELFATFYAASVHEKALREFSTEEWLDLMRILYTLWQRGTGYEQALGDIGILAKLEGEKRRRAARVPRAKGGKKRRAVKNAR